MDLTTLTDTEARDLLAAVYADVQRRDAIAQAPTQAEALATAYAAAIGRKDGDPYPPVTRHDRCAVGAHDAYSFGATVTHTGRVWESTVAGERSNTWAPGVYGWKDLGPA